MMCSRSAARRSDSCSVVTSRKKIDRPVGTREDPALDPPPEVGVEGSRHLWPLQPHGVPQGGLDLGCDGRLAPAHPAHQVVAAQHVRTDLVHVHVPPVAVQGREALRDALDRLLQQRPAGRSRAGGRPAGARREVDPGRDPGLDEGAPAVQTPHRAPPADRLRALGHAPQPEVSRG